MKPDKIVYDCESQKLFSEIKDRSKIWDLKLSTAVTYSYREDFYKFWTVNQQTELLEYLNGNIVIGFNNIGFDNPLIMGENHKLDEKGNSSNGKYSWINYDILVEIKKKLYAIPENTSIQEVFNIFRKNFSPADKGIYKLDSVAKATLNHGKYGDGGNAVELFRSKKILELVNYNLQDVRITKQLYDFIKTYRYVLNGNYDVIAMD